MMLSFFSSSSSSVFLFLLILSTLLHLDVAANATPPSLLPQPDQKLGVGCLQFSLFGSNFLTADVLSLSPSNTSSSGVSGVPIPPRVSVSLLLSPSNIIIPSSIVPNSIQCLGSLLCALQVRIQSLEDQYIGEKLYAAVNRSGLSSGYVLTATIVGGVSIEPNESMILHTGDTSIVLKGENFATGDAVYSNIISFSVQNNTKTQIITGIIDQATEDELTISFVTGPVYDPNPFILLASISTYGVTTEPVQVATIHPASVDQTSILTCQGQGMDGSLRVNWGTPVACAITIRGNNAPRPGTLSDYQQPTVIHGDGPINMIQNVTNGEDDDDDDDDDNIKKTQLQDDHCMFHDVSLNITYRSISNSSNSGLCGNIVNITLSTDGMSIAFWYYAGSGMQHEAIIVRTHDTNTLITGAPLMVTLINPAGDMTPPFWSIHNEIFVILVVCITCVALATCIVMMNAYCTKQQPDEIIQQEREHTPIMTATNTSIAPVSLSVATSAKQASPLTHSRSIIIQPRYTSNTIITSQSPSQALSQALTQPLLHDTTQHSDSENDTYQRPDLTRHDSPSLHLQQQHDPYHDYHFNYQ